MRERAREEISTPNQTQPPRSRRRGRATPRPLAVQRLAGDLVAPEREPHPAVSAGDRRRFLAGIGRGHIGGICDALTVAGIDPGVWSARAIIDAIAADMRATGWSWPDRIERPGAFLAARLRRLPARPGGASPNGGGSAAAGLDKTAGVATPRTPLVFSDAQRTRIAAAQAHVRQQLDESRQRRTSTPTAAAPTLTHRAASGPAVAQPSADTCVRCGGPDPVRRPYMPVPRADVCDDCWTVWSTTDQVGD